MKDIKKAVTMERMMLLEEKCQEFLQFDEEVRKPGGLCRETLSPVFNVIADIMKGLDDGAMFEVANVSLTTGDSQQLLGRLGIDSDSRLLFVVTPDDCRDMHIVKGVGMKEIPLVEVDRLGLSPTALVELMLNFASNTQIDILAESIATMDWAEA